MERTYLFIHGAWHGKWCWKEILKIFKQNKLKAYAIDLPGHGTKKYIRDVLLEDYIDYCLSFIKEKNLKNLVLVGHNFAGVIISNLAEEIPERINKLVYLASVVLNNESFLDIIPKEFAENFKKQAEENPNSLLVLPPKIIHNLFLNSIAFNDKRTNFVLKNINSQPFRPFTEKIMYNESNLSKIYISCKKDNAVNSDLVKKALKILKCSHIELDADHDVMITNPELLARTLFAV